MRIKKGDTVLVITGKEKGKKGKVLQFFPERKRVLVQGVNFVKKHARQTRQDQPGGILQKESTMHVSNVMFFCAKCGKAVRLGSKFLADGSKVRICKTCNEAV